MSENSGLKRPADSDSNTSITRSSPQTPKAIWPIFNVAKRRCTGDSTPTINAGKKTDSSSKMKSELHVTPSKTPIKPVDDQSSPRVSKARFDTPSPTESRLVVDKDDPIRTPFRTPMSSRNVNSYVYETPKRRDYTTPSATPSRHSEGTPRIELAPSDEVIKHPHLEYEFLYPPHRRDIEKRKPDDPDYDEKTLYVPISFLDSQTPALRQWWVIKQQNMDAILFFKMGKFYELFNEDAVIAVNHLDIMYMKGDETKPAHAGFPEVSYEKYSKVLIEKGFKVIRIEQTETPSMMEERCQRTGRKGKFDRVVDRAVCRITTKGTQMLGVMESVFHSSQNQYLLAICETAKDTADDCGLKSTIFGVCFIDVTVSKLYLGQFEDDHNLSKLNILLSHHNPTEVLYERGNLRSETYRALLKTGAVLSVLKPGKEFWPLKKALTYIKENHIFQDESDTFEWPPFLKGLFEGGDSPDNLMALEPKDEFKVALSSFAALVYYLQSQLIANQVLECITFEVYCSPLERLSNRACQTTLQLQPMIMDHVALRNLEIFENNYGGSSSTLFESINYCKTHFGQRLLKSWLCSPLCDIKQINNRLDAVESLISNDNASLVNEIIHVLGQTPDLERLLTKIKSQCFKSEGDSRAIMFDGNQHSKAKISSFLNLLTNFKRLRKFVISISISVQRCNSNVLRRLLTFTTEDGLFPEYGATLDYFDSAFDHELAKKTGQIIPAPGVDKTYDSCQSQIDSIKARLDGYLEEQKKVLRCKNIEYFGSAKNRYQIQIPESNCNSVPSEYRIETTRKGVKRYYTPTIDKLFKKLMCREEELKKALDSIMSNIFEQFSRKAKLWSAAIECIAIVDVLQSIASFVRSLKANDVDICRPEFLDSSNELIEYLNGRHPALVKRDPNYIPNDLKLDSKLILLSGANMGGKSTLMRQTALLVILAQVGCFVPASSMKLTPVDRIFSRLGASDCLLEGESTFYTELVETSAMLRCATKDSLLLLDELGRGTSTYDGTAIAYAVLQEISENIKCRCLFSTHYHTLVRDFENVDTVRLAHMACKVEKKTNVGEVDLDPLKENITFLYKITEGPVGRSYGFNVAKLAGIQDEIIKCAFDKAKEMELSCKILDTLQKLSLSEGSQLKMAGKMKDRVLAAIAMEKQ